MKLNNNSAVELCNDDDRNSGTEVVDVCSNKNLCDQFIDKFMGLPEEIRGKVQVSIAAQGPGVKFPGNGFGDLEVIPPKFQIVISPILTK